MFIIALLAVYSLIGTIQGTREYYLVQKRHVLNEIRANHMTLQELRFFSIYLSRINKDKPLETRVVRFPLEDFQKIMDLVRLDIGYMKRVTNSLLCKVVNVPNERGGYSGFQLFKECTVDTDDRTGEWYVEIDAHDKALPLMFEFKDKYLQYQLWNALRLSSANQLRMYEILKQYEKIGHRVLTVEELKDFLGIGKAEYPRFGDFKTHVLSVCQKALAERTDIKFTYESHGKKGLGGKILALKFKIEKNDDYIDQMNLDMYTTAKEDATVIDAEDVPSEVDDIIDIAEASIESEDTIDSSDEPVSDIYRERIEFFRSACNNEFSYEDIVTFNDILLKHLPFDTAEDNVACYDYIKRAYNGMLSRDNVKHRLGYTRWYLEDALM
jgi:plasmid replication initiation protein